NYAKATVQAKVRIEEPDEHLRVDGAAQVQFLSQDPREAPAASQTRPTIWIPTAAVQTEAGETIVYVVVDSKAKRTPIRTGRNQSGQVEVLQGLSDGQTIVAKIPEAMKDGQRVR
ncbi:MAG: hypothetical protein HZB38_15190, partial [Planctomycetes bacterium]|nr:hypothetical protein [Planctomycetota bacterium]